MAAMRWGPTRAIFAAQDTIPASSRRIIARYSLSGAQDWHVPDGTLDPGDLGSGGAPRRYPDDVTWRTLAPFRARLTPGCQLEAHVCYAPSGLVQHDFDGMGTWVSDGAWGKVRVRCTWDPDGASEGPHDFSLLLEGSQLGTWGGLEPQGYGGGWNKQKERKIEAIEPPDYRTDPTVAQDFSEWVTVEGTIDVLGGARIIAVVLYEVPVAHVSDHDDSAAQTVHAVPSPKQQTPMPQTKAADGATYEEHRFGTTRMLQVAQRQNERLGPRFWIFTAWDEDEANIWQASEATPITSSTTSPADLWDPTITSFDADNPGFVISGAHALVHRLNDANLIIPGTNRAILPVRFFFDAELASGNGGWIRVQTGAFEYEDIEITKSRDWYTAVGLVECQVYDDHAEVNGQVFLWHDSGGDGVSLYAAAIEFGDW